MHAAKGLEYDIVMIPFAGFGKPFASTTPMFHIEDQGGNFAPAIDFANQETNKAQQQLEDFNESMRLMYVAMTRARYCCYVGVPLIRDIKSTPVRRLLGFAGKEVAEVEAELLEKLPAELFEIQTLITHQTTQYQPATAAPLLAAPPIMPAVHTHWRMHSYTGLTRLLKHDEPDHESFQPRPGYGDDDMDTAQPDATGPSRFNFPRGARVGIVLHDFMEQLDFSATEIIVSAQAERSLAKMGLEDPDGVWQKVLVEWFQDIVATPMSVSAPFSLKDISRSRRLDEMEFHFPIDASRRLIDRLQSANVLSRNLSLQVEKLQGMMTGYVDLIVAHENKYYLIDYKSNDLGPTQSAYGPDALSGAIKSHHYDLQYLIYCVALNRYLQQRIAHYDYETHFGGVFYLFLRGMDGQPGAGVFADQPDFELIQQLDQLLTQPAPQLASPAGSV